MAMALPCPLGGARKTQRSTRTESAVTVNSALGTLTLLLSAIQKKQSATRLPFASILTELEPITLELLVVSSVARAKPRLINSTLLLGFTSMSIGSLAT